MPHTPSQMPELKPCPFCGGEANEEHDEFTAVYTPNAPFVKCCNCRARGMDPIKWNTRAASVPSDKERAALVDELLELQRLTIEGSAWRELHRSGDDSWARMGEDLKRYSDRMEEIKRALTAPDQSETIKALKEALERAKSRFNMMSGCERNGATAIAGYNDAEQALAILDRMMNGGK